MHAVLNDLGWRFFGLVVRVSSMLPFNPATSRVRQALISRYVMKSRLFE